MWKCANVINVKMANKSAGLEC